MVQGGEVGLRGKYIDPYMGKVYGRGNPSTEIINVSIESFSNPESMSRLYRAHPELFKIIVGLSGQK